MANGWTPERRAKMAEIVRQWKPWEKSTGPVTAKGKRKASKNASHSARGIFKGRVRNILKASSELKTNQEPSMTGEALPNKGIGIDTTGPGDTTELNHPALNPPAQASTPVGPAFPAGMVRSRYR